MSDTEEGVDVYFADVRFNQTRGSGRTLARKTKRCPAGFLTVLVGGYQSPWLRDAVTLALRRCRRDWPQFLSRLRG